MVTVCGLTLSFIEQVFAVPLLSLYTDTPEAIEYGVLRMRTVVVFYFVAGIMEIFNHSLRGIGYSFTPMIIALGGTCAFRLLWIYTVYPAWHEFLCLLLSWPASWIVTGTVEGIFLVVNYKKRVQEHELLNAPLESSEKSA